MNYRLIVIFHSYMKHNDITYVIVTYARIDSHGILRFNNKINKMCLLIYKIRDLI